MISKRMAGTAQSYLEIVSASRHHHNIKLCNESGWGQVASSKINKVYAIIQTFRRPFVHFKY